MTEQTLQKSENPIPNNVSKQLNEQGFLSRLRAKLGFENSQTLRETIEDALESEKPAEENFSKQERSMLLNILRFGALRVEDVMVPRADIIALDENASLNELLKLFEMAGHSRIPLYRETLDDPMGMVHIKDLMRWITSRAVEKPVPESSRESRADGDTLTTIDLSSVDLGCSVGSSKIQRDVLFVPPSMSVVDLLLRMQTTRVHLALVVDEYGGTDGLVSIEDLVEEIVGEIEDEHDVDGKPLIRDDPDQGLIVDARTPIGDLEARLKRSLILPDREEDEFDTLGGMVFSMVGRVPVRGELIYHPSGLEIEVLDADPRRIKSLRVHTKVRNKTKFRNPVRPVEGQSKLDP